MAIRRLRPWLLAISDQRGGRYSILAPIRVNRQYITRSRRVTGDGIAVLLAAKFAAIVFTGIIAALSMLKPIVPGMEPLASGTAYAMLAAMALLVLGAVIAVPLFVRSCAKTNARRQLLARICPGCGYSMEGLAPEADGCTTCPECSGVWRTAPFARKYSAPLPLPERTARAGLAGELGRRWHLLFAIADDRGVPWSIYLPGSVNAAHMPRSKQERQFVQNFCLGTGIVLAAYFAICFAADFTARMCGAPNTPERAGSLSLAFAAAFLSLLVTGHWLASRQASTHLRQNLECGACSVCGRSLTDLPASPDGCTQCPDCGAAWQVPPKREP